MWARVAAKSTASAEIQGKSITIIRQGRVASDAVSQLLSDCRACATAVSVVNPLLKRVTPRTMVALTCASTRALALSIATGNALAAAVKIRAVITGTLFAEIWTYDDPSPRERPCQQETGPQWYDLALIRQALELAWRQFWETLSWYGL